MPSSTPQNGKQQHQCDYQLDNRDLTNRDERRHRYEDLKNSVAVLRSRFRSTPTATPCPSSPSSLHNTDLASYSTYFSSACTTTRDRSRSSYCVNQVEACSLLESYAMQALRLDCETRLREGREELAKVREKLKDKVRRTELFDRELEKQRRKLEGTIEFFSERSKTLEKQLAEQSVRHKEELWAQSQAFGASRKQEEEERRQQAEKMISNYEDTVATLKETNDGQLAEIQRLKQELNSRLEQMEKNKHSNEDQLKHLEGQVKSVVQQSETFKMSYEEQERELNLKLQHVTAMHQYQTKILRPRHLESDAVQESNGSLQLLGTDKDKGEDFDFQLEILRKEMKDERDQQNSKLQAYKAQKLLDMENVEQRVKGVLEMKDSTIAKLKLELKTLHQQLNASVSMLDDDCATGSPVKPV